MQRGLAIHDSSLASTLIRYHRLLGRGRKSVEFAAQEPGPGKNSLKLSERVSIAVGCAGEHDEREAGCRRRRDAIGLGDEFQRDCSAARRRAAYALAANCSQVGTSK